MAGNAGKVFEHPMKGTYPLRQIYLVRPKAQSAEMHPELVLITLATGKVDRLDLFQRGLDWVQAIDWR